jgi:hypothetical protein
VYQYIFSLLNEGVITEAVSFMHLKDSKNRIITFNSLINKTSFTSIMDKILRKLEEGYGIPVDIEFVADLDQGGKGKLNLLQCRPLSEVRDQENISLPEQIDPGEIIFQTDSCVNTAEVDAVRYLVYVDTDGYHELPEGDKHQVGRAIGQINSFMDAADERYILVGPGRWGSSNIDLGVPVSYADIDNAAAIVEVAKNSEGYVPEVSYGTHFFQDLVEDRIYYLAVYPGLALNFLNEAYFSAAPNLLPTMAPDHKKLAALIRVIQADGGGKGFRLVMHRQKGRAVCYRAS